MGSWCRGMALLGLSVGLGWAQLADAKLEDAGLLRIPSESAAVCPKFDRAQWASKMTSVDFARDGQLTIEFDTQQRFVGLRIEHIRVCGFFDQLGLKDHDILLGFNETPFTTFEAVAAFRSVLITPAAFSLQVYRDGITQIVTVD